MRRTIWPLAPSVAALMVVAGTLASGPPPAEGSGTETRTRGGLLALYDFRGGGGSVVKDQAGVGEPLDLHIDDAAAVRWGDGSLEVRGETRIRSEKPAARIIEAIRRTGEITVEAWIRPAAASQSGPARIVTLSESGSARNVTLGQDGDRFDVRFRTTTTNPNGIKSVSSPEKTVRTELTHVVYTRDRRGRARIYVDGERTTDGRVPGGTGSWQRDFRIGIANEFRDSRPWLGEYHLVAVYGRDLSPKEIERHYRAGPRAETAPPSEPLASASHRFETRVAPLLAEHCLECHDAATKKGRLDLSHRDAALAGGKEGPPIIPGKAAESLLWEVVAADEMPKKRPPLSAEEKALLREWIDAGAEWSLETIDPADYVRGHVAEGWIRRLTVEEYIETVRHAVGVDIAAEAREVLPPDLRADGFSNTAYNLKVDLEHVDAYASLAESIVERMDVKAFARRFSKSRKLTDDSMRGLIAAMGKWLLRGPLEEREVVALRGISTTVASAGGDYDEAVRYTIQAMLQSPRFIYRVENQRGDGTPWELGDWELASRLSYILWGGPPDEELLRAAEAGDLQDDEVLRSQARRMLDDPRAVERSKRFLFEWLDLGRLDNLRPGAETFPGWRAELAADMREETLAFFEAVVWKERRPLADLLNAQVTYLTPRLAAHYGLEPSGDGDGASRYDLSTVASRGGLLTQGSVLTVGGDDASMVTRGLFVLHDLLRGTVKDPPPCVDTSPVPTKPGLTRRGVAEGRLANPACGGCHAKFEPFAFGLERYDGVGGYHEKDEHGNALREDGEIVFPGQGEPVAYRSSAELMDRLAASERVRECITWKVTQFALGRPLVAADVREVRAIHRSAQEGGGTYASLMTAIVMSDLVRMTRTETDG